TRRLKPGARAIAPGELLPVSPVDGTIGELGDIVESRLYQAKGKHYTLAELIGGPRAEEDARQLACGGFCTIYLWPCNYPRVHALGWPVAVLFAPGVKLAPRLLPGLQIRVGEALESP